MIQSLVPRDERELSVDLAADRLSYLVLAFGLLGIVAWRSFANDEAPWDLLTLVIVSGIAGTLYRVWRGAVSGAGSSSASRRSRSPSWSRWSSASGFSARRRLRAGVLTGARPGRPGVRPD